MIKAETVEQFYVLKWLEANFVTELLGIKLVDRYTVKIVLLTLAKTTS